MHTVRIGSATLIRGDARDVLPMLGRFESLITDPPYGVDFKGKTTKRTTNAPSRVYVDNERNFQDSVLPIVSASLAQSARAAIFSGTRRIQEYPSVTDIGGIVCPNGAGLSRWGFGCYNPILFYGGSPYMAKGLGARPTATSISHPGMHVTGERVAHPCQKPLAFMLWVVKIASLEGDTILDPFMGSGTTGVAALQLGRRFTGIELDPVFFRLACARLRAAVGTTERARHERKPGQSHRYRTLRGQHPTRRRAHALVG